MKAFTNELVPYVLLEVGAWLVVLAMAVVLLPLTILRSARAAATA